MQKCIDTIKIGRYKIRCCEFPNRNKSKQNSKLLCCYNCWHFAYIRSFCILNDRIHQSSSKLLLFIQVFDSFVWQRVIFFIFFLVVVVVASIRNCSVSFILIALSIKWSWSGFSVEKMNRWCSCFKRGIFRHFVFNQWMKKKCVQNESDEVLLYIST